MFPGDPTARGRWSGTSSGVVGGLQELGIEVHAVNVDASPQISRWLSLAAGGLMVTSIARAGLPLAPRELRRVGLITPAVAAMRSVLAQRRLRESVPLDGLIQIGTGYSVTTSLPLVTFEDMTTVQACDAEYAEWRAMPRRAVTARVTRQRKAYRRARGCCVCTHWAAESVVSDYAIPPEKVHVVGVGRNFEPPGAVTRDWSTPRFLFVGRDWSRKNGERVLAAFSRLRTEVPDARLDVVGAHPPLHADGLVGHGVLQLTDSAPPPPASPSLFANATCFVMPSLHEPAGLAYVEACGMGASRASPRPTEAASELVGARRHRGRPDATTTSCWPRCVKLCDPTEAEGASGGIAEQRSPAFHLPHDGGAPPARTRSAVCRGRAAACVLVSRRVPHAGSVGMLPIDCGNVRCTRFGDRESPGFLHRRVSQDRDDLFVRDAQGASSDLHARDQGAPLFLASDLAPHPKLAKERYGRRFSRAPSTGTSRCSMPLGPEQRVGEASTFYLWSRTAADRIADLQPRARIIAILRDPADFPSLAASDVPRDGASSPKRPTPGNLPRSCEERRQEPASALPPSAAAAVRRSRPLRRPTRSLPLASAARPDTRTHIRGLPSGQRGDRAQGPALSRRRR